MTVPTVLIIEDDPGIALLLETLLAADGYATETLADGNDALERLCEPPPDAVVLDVGLPYTDGLNVLRTIRANPRWADVPVVIASGHNTDEQITEGHRAGADHYLVKPFDPFDLRSTLRELLAGCSAPSREPRV
jgi:DNA-binding response OmpR family regulator